MQVLRQCRVRAPCVSCNLRTDCAAAVRRVSLIKDVLVGTFWRAMRVCDSGALRASKAYRVESAYGTVPLRDQREDEPKRGSYSWGAVHAYGSTMLLDDGLADIEPQPQPDS